MRILSLVLKEIAHRKVGSGLSLLAVVAAVALPVAFFATARATTVETRRVMRDLGYNLRIIPAGTDMDEFWSQGYSLHTMPEEAVVRFATREDLSFTHLIPYLIRSIEWRGQEVLLTGLADEVVPGEKRKDPITAPVAPGTLRLGYQTARSLAIKKGEQVELLGQTFTVAHCHAETGTRDDSRVFAHLDDVQELLDLDGEINEIEALNCLCLDPEVDTLTMLREQLREVLPGAHVLQKKTLADAREQQRATVERSFVFLVPCVLVVCAAWIALLAVLNARERIAEVAVFRALGYESSAIAGLFLGKAVVLGVAGAIVGFALGTWLSRSVGPQLFPVTAGDIAVDPLLLGIAVIAAPLFSAVSSLIPTAWAVSQDPAATLRAD